MSCENCKGHVDPERQLDRRLILGICIAFAVAELLTIALFVWYEQQFTFVSTTEQVIVDSGSGGDATYIEGGRDAVYGTGYQNNDNKDKNAEGREQGR